jgi:hypothetical protein
VVLLHYSMGNTPVKLPEPWWHAAKVGLNQSKRT